MSFSVFVAAARSCGSAEIGIEKKANTAAAMPQMKEMLEQSTKGGNGGGTRPAKKSIGDDRRKKTYLVEAGS